MKTELEIMKEVEAELQRRGYQRITDPGKFEGELSIVPKMWDLVLEGLSADVFFGEGETYSFVCLLAQGQEANELQDQLDGLDTYTFPRGPFQTYEELLDALLDAYDYAE